MFASKGFDSIISKDLHLSGDMILDPGSKVQIDGSISNFKNIKLRAPADPANTDLKKEFKTHVIINGDVNGSASNKDGKIEVNNLTINGRVSVSEIWVEGTLHLQSNCRLFADKVYYRDIKMDAGAVIVANLRHLDHVSEGEIT